MTRLIRVAGALGMAGAGVALLAAPVGAHVTPDKEEVPAGSFNSVVLTVGHGCEESPTREVSVQIPEGINDVTPGILPGWTINVVKTPLAEPIDDGHGGQLTERESEVVFTANPGNELPDGFRQGYTIGFRTPETEGEYLFFKTIQRCAVGETAWIEEYTEETGGEEPEHPSPVVLIGPAEEEGGDDTTATTLDEAVETQETAATSDDADDDSDSATGIAVAGLVVGALGLAAGGLALFRSRSATSS